MLFLSVPGMREMLELVTRPKVPLDMGSRHVEIAFPRGFFGTPEALDTEGLTIST